MKAETVLHSELFYLLVGGVAALIVWFLIKKGRHVDEEPSIVERILMFAGIVATLTALLILVFRADVLQKPGQQGDEEEHELTDYSKEGAGCSKPSKSMKDFENP